jgi:hypothetical protein
LIGQALFILVAVFIAVLLPGPHKGAGQGGGGTRVVMSLAGRVEAEVTIVADTRPGGAS